MADKAIKVAVLEGNFASLCALGFPLSLSLQLQQSCLRLDEAMWTAKSTTGGFSVSFFWPAPDLKSEVQLKRKRKRRRAKARKTVPAATNFNDKPTLEPLKPSLEATCASSALPTPNNATQLGPASKSSQGSGCSPSPPHSAEESELKNQSDETEQQWTQVTTRRRRKARLPPCWKLRFPAHLRANLQTPSESSSTSEVSSEGEETDDGEQHQCTKHSEHTPVASRTRSKLKS